MQGFLVFFSILSILIFTLYSALLKPLSDLSHFLIKDSIINITIIIVIIIIIIININIIIVIILIIIIIVHASHGRCVNSGNFSPITRSQQAASKDLWRIFADSLFQAFG